MNAVVRFDKPLLHLVADLYPCAFCWSRGGTQTRMRDERNRPICPACADNPNRRQAMPRFVVAHINEARHDY